MIEGSFLIWYVNRVEMQCIEGRFIRIGYDNRDIIIECSF